MAGSILSARAFWFRGTADGVCLPSSLPLGEVVAEVTKGGMAKISAIICALNGTAISSGRSIIGLSLPL